MSYSSLNLSVRDILKDVAKEVVLPHYQNLKTADIEEKSPGDLVTVADRLSEEMLGERLTALLPDAAIVGEEASAADPSAMDHLGDKRTWIIDPIDGTGNFAAGKPPFGMIVALSQENETVAGWLYDPLKDRLCYAAKGQGAFINGEKLSVSVDPDGKPIAALATGFMTSEQRDKLLNAADGHYEIVDIPRCAAEQYPRLALGTNHISTFERSLPWDHAAGILFLNEAGGKAARWNGDPYRPADRRTGLLGASSPQLWDEAAELLGDVFAD
ncbi:inositol monophosphatase family protein [Parasphingorhabdus litoris]|uniref:Inositol monophosphatase family protein n=1 Tax=Parasphingorhabdus litoris TaxID=394733 RepID=A0ABN1AQK4_9SPHN|nr:inositol monophosphatase family protein [Parasphingorhabdus litoris]